MMAVMTLLWAFEHSCHAEIKTIQKLSTVSSHAADLNCQKMSNRRTRATPQIRRLVVGFSLRKTGFDPGEVQVGSAVGKLKTVQFFSRYFGILLSNITPPTIRIHWSIIRWVGLGSKTVSPHLTQRPDADPLATTTCGPPQIKSRGHRIRNSAPQICRNSVNK